MTREFDLNIERVLENWTVAHALREVIANALDEQALTGTAEPQIFADAENRWHIRDWGRGLRYEHLTQNENKEKLNHPDQVVGKFGVGLKDALATFDRHRISVVIRSRHGDITTGKQAKHGFDDIETLHALITDPADPGFAGTEFILSGRALTERQVDEAKGLFLRYSGDEELGVTPFGSVLRRTDSQGQGAHLRQRAAGGRRRQLPVLVQHHLAHRGAAPRPEPGAQQRRPQRLHRPGEGDPAGL